MVLLAAIIAVGLFGLFLWRRRKARRSVSASSTGVTCWLLLGSGSSWSLRRVKREGFMLYDGVVEYPVSDCVAAVRSADFADDLFVLAADNVALVDYETFSRLKKDSIKGALLKPQSDLGSMLQWAGSVAVIVAAITVWMGNSSVNASLVAQQAQIKAIGDSVSRLVVAK